LLVCDDIGYVQQASDEIDVLFTLLAERYERRSVITSNLVFSGWGSDLQEPDGHPRQRSARAPLRHPRVRDAELPYRTDPASGPKAKKKVG
jgi:IstB-like ATP binding protein